MGRMVGGEKKGGERSIWRMVRDEKRWGERSECKGRGQERERERVRYLGSGFKFQ